MSYSGEAAEQVVRMSLNGVEIAAKITGKAAERLAVLLYAVLKDQNKTRGKARLSNMLKSGKPLRVFAVRDDELKRFCEEAKKYGVLYCVLKDTKLNDGTTDVMVREDDVGKINRIFERLKLSSVDLAAVRTEVSRELQHSDAEPSVPERLQSMEERMEQFLNEVVAGKSVEEVEHQGENPMEARTSKSHRSEPLSENKRDAGNGLSLNSDRSQNRPSVRAALKEIREEQEKAAAERVLEHIPVLGKKEEKEGR